MLRQSVSLSPKTRLNKTLRSWLGILYSGLDELKETLEPFCQTNPFVTIENKKEAPKKNFFNEISKKSVSDTLEAVVVQKDSLWQTLINQINPPLFPTQKSQEIAYKIIECINNEGYFEYEEQILNGFNESDVERIRARFCHLEPIGVGAKNLKESFLFQLDSLEVDDEIYKFSKTLIENFEDLTSFTKDKNYEKSISVIKKFKNPPAVEYLKDDETILADLFVTKDDDGIKVGLNDEYYPQIVLDIDGLNQKDEFVQSKIKEAKDLADALQMRKSTLYKIGLMIVEYQYDYFLGGDIKPMKLKNIADDIGRNQSTISRAISNKYLSCQRGTIPLKSFFATALDEDTSNAAIKSYISKIIKDENRQKPMSDLAILELVQGEFGIKMVRRTITKYRKELNIASSSERKKIYSIKC